MLEVASFTFNAFQENTYILHDETNECVIFDPGMQSHADERVFMNYIDAKELKPVHLINTHCHIDHVFGNKFVAETFGLKLAAHKGEIPVLEYVPVVCDMYGLPYIPSPPIEIFIEDEEIITFGGSKLEALFTPGHSPASLSFYNKESKTLIAGDVLFDGSIGRTDLPGGDFDTLISSIKNRMFPLGDEVKVFPGHGPMTTIGKEKASNPFLNP